MTAFHVGGEEHVGVGLGRVAQNRVLMAEPAAVVHLAPRAADEHIPIGTRDRNRVVLARPDRVIHEVLHDGLLH